MSWQILILSQASRQEMYDQLVDELQQQIDRRFIKFQGYRREVEISTRDYDITLSLGTNRQIMLERADAEYVSFFDDDDWPAPNFVERIFRLLDRDYVGFRVQTYCAHLNFCEYGNTYHSLEYGKWDRNGMDFLRDISHLNPIRRELALRFPMSGGYGEDCRWANGLRALDCVKTEHYIPEVMYHYIWRAVKNDETDATDPRRLALIEKIRKGQKWPTESASQQIPSASSN